MDKSYQHDGRTTASSWTLETLHEHSNEVCRLQELRINEKFNAMEKATAMALQAAAEAVNKAERLADERAKAQDRLAEANKAQQNEWRGTINDLASMKMGREEGLAVHATMLEKIDAISARMDRNEGRGIGSNATWVWVFIGLAGLISILTLILDLFLEH